MGEKFGDNRVFYVHGVPKILVPYLHIKHGSFFSVLYRLVNVLSTDCKAWCTSASSISPTENYVNLNVVQKLFTVFKETDSFGLDGLKGWWALATRLNLQYTPSVLVEK